MLRLRKNINTVPLNIHKLQQLAALCVHARYREILLKVIQVSVSETPAFVSRMRSTIAHHTFSEREQKISDVLPVYTKTNTTLSQMPQHHVMKSSGRQGNIALSGWLILIVPGHVPNLFY
jgi:hypothetical protein